MRDIEKKEDKMNKKEWMKKNLRLRERLIKRAEGQNKYLLASFLGTKQQKDIERRTPLIQDYFRVKINVKAFSETEMQRKGKHVIDFKDNGQVYDALGDEFDMPYWAFHSLEDKQPLADYNNIFIWQLKGCNLRCPWCYVDDINKNGREGHGSGFFSTEKIIDVFEEERKKQPLYMIRPSGGEPTLAIEQWLETLRELDRRGLGRQVYVQGDTNLTTGSFIEQLEGTEIEPNFLHRVGDYDNFGVLCSFKGTDTESFLEATGLPKGQGYEFLEEERWHAFGNLVRAGIDAYPFIYDSSPETLESFMEKGAREYGPGFYLKTWVFRLKFYGPEKERLERSGVNPEEKQKRLDENFKRSEEIMQNLIWSKFGLNYKAIPRTGIKLQA